MILDRIGRWYDRRLARRHGVLTDAEADRLIAAINDDDRLRQIIPNLDLARKNNTRRLWSDGTFSHPSVTPGTVCPRTAPDHQDGPMCPTCGYPWTWHRSHSTVCQLDRIEVAGEYGPRCALCGCPPGCHRRPSTHTDRMNP
jgi:hypothetical protein